MEALLVVIAIFVGPVMATVGAALAALVVEAVVLLASLVLELLSLRRRRRGGPPSVVLRWLRRIGLACLALGVILLLVVETFGFDPLVRWSVSRSPDAQIEFEVADGSVLGGHVTLTGVTLQREDAERGSFDLTLAEIGAEIGLGGAMARPFEIDRLTARGVAGTFTRDLDVRLPPKAFVVDEVFIQDAAIDLVLDWRDRSQSFRIEIEEWTCGPYRSDRAWFDVMLRGQGRGSFAGRPLRIEHLEPTGDLGPGVRWTIEALPLEQFASWLGGAATLLSNGTVNAVIEDREVPGQVDTMRSRWRLEFDGLEIRAPEGAGLTTRIALQPLAAWFSAERRSFDLAFTLELKADDIPSGGTPPTALFRNLAASAVLQALIAKTGLDAEKWGGVIDGLLEKLR